MKRQNNLAIVGIGNELCKDDGFGILAVRELKKKNLTFGTLLEGATYGISLLPLFFEYENLIFLDIIKLDDKPGSIYVIPFEKIEGSSFNIVSIHDMGLEYTYFQAKMLGSKANCYLVGIVPHNLNGYGKVSDFLIKKMECYLSEVITLASKISKNNPI